MITADFVPELVDSREFPLVLVCGPWSSGTSAVAGVLANLGLCTPGPHAKINDPSTPLTFEMEEFRRLLNRLASEETLTKLVPDEQVKDGLRTFKQNKLQQFRNRCSNHQPLVLKHALATLMLREIGDVFDLRVVGVIRPTVDIERTRMRRNWTPEFGALGAKIIYDHLFSFYVDSLVPVHFIRYPELLTNAARVVDGLIDFLGLRVMAKVREAAIRSVRPVAEGAGPVPSTTIPG